MLVAHVRNGPGRGVFRPLPRHPANPHRLGIGRGVGVSGQDIGVQLDRGPVEIGDGGGGRDAGRQENRRSDQEKFLHEVCPFSDAAPGAADGTVVARAEVRRAGVGYFAMMGRERMGGWRADRARPSLGGRFWGVCAGVLYGVTTLRRLRSWLTLPCALPRGGSGAPGLVARVGCGWCRVRFRQSGGASVVCKPSLRLILRLTLGLQRSDLLL